MRQRLNNLWEALKTQRTGRQLSAGLHNLLSGVSLSARRLPRHWRYYSLPLLVVALGIIAGYGQMVGLLPGSLQEIREEIQAPKEADLFAPQIINLVESEEPETDPVVPSVSPTDTQPKEAEPIAPEDTEPPEAITPEGSGEGAAELPEVPAPIAEAVGLTPGVPVLVRPLEGKTITGFGTVYSATHLDYRFHPGLDFMAAPGDAVRAALAGEVLAVEQTAEYAYLVTIRHAGNRTTLYGNCAAVMVVPGQKVGAGEIIATTGDSGLAELADGCHLHFCLLEEGEAIDPSPCLP